MAGAAARTTAWTSTRYAGCCFIRRSGPVEHEGISRRTYEWVGYRPSRRNDDSTFTYGYSLLARVAPVSMWRRWKRKLAFMESNIRLQPSTPDFGF